MKFYDPDPVYEWLVVEFFVRSLTTVIRFKGFKSIEALEKGVKYVQN